MSDPTPPAELSDTQKVLVMLSEIRQCINDDHLMAAQRKVFAIEGLIKAALVAPPADEVTQTIEYEEFDGGGWVPFTFTGTEAQFVALMENGRRKWQMRVKPSAPAGLREPIVFRVEVWEGDDYVVTANGRPIGQTVHWNLGTNIVRWLATIAESELVIVLARPAAIPETET